MHNTLKLLLMFGLSLVADVSVAYASFLIVWRLFHIEDAFSSAHMCFWVSAAIALSSTLCCRKFWNQRIYVRAKPAPVIRAAAYLSLFFLLSVAFESRLPWQAHIIFYMLVYCGQLWVDKLDDSLGGYALLLDKAFFYFLRERKKPRATAFQPDCNRPLLVVDVSSWYRLSKSDIKRIASHFSDYQLVDSLFSLERQHYRNVEIMFAAPPRAILNQMTGLKWLHLPSSGMNGYDALDLYPGHTRVTSSVGVFGEPISEYAIAQMLMLSKGLHSAVINNKCGYGHDIQHAICDFNGCTVLLLGVGDIGKNIAVKSKALGARVIGVSRTTGANVEHVDCLYRMNQLNEIIGESDFVVLSLPQSSETNDVINLTRLRRMKPTAILVNVGRGNAVNQRDLRYALRKRLIAGAALDVSSPDPLLPHNALFSYKNLLCTLHHASISHSNSARAVDVFLEVGKAYARRN